MTTFVGQVAKTRRQDTRNEATAEAQSVKTAERQRRKQIREHNRLLWIAHFKRLAAELRARAEDYESRALSLARGRDGRVH